MNSYLRSSLARGFCSVTVVVVGLAVGLAVVVGAAVVGLAVVGAAVVGAEVGAAVGAAG